jgi:V8-like Glu-specific endopeptidase
MARTRRLTLLCCCAVVASIAGLARASELRVPRERVLGQNMTISTIGPFRSTPYKQKSGLVWAQIVIHSSAVRAIRIHAQINDSQAVAKWKLKFKDLNGTEMDEIASDSPQVRSGDIWSDEIRGRGGLVELWADSDPTGLEVVIDRYAYTDVAAIPKSISGKDERQPIHGAPPNVRGWGVAVARLRFMTSSGQALCTGFLISNDLMLTNEHCIRTTEEMYSLVAEFGYDNYGSVPERFRARALEATNSVLDYSVLRLIGNPGARWGKVKLGAKDEIVDNRALVIIQHPAGEPKQVSIYGCLVSGTKRRGIKEDTDFGHLCDTLGGSSGSPVFSLSSGTVVGLHHFGFVDDAPDPVNQAVYIGLILEDLRQKVPSVFQELQPAP